MDATADPVLLGGRYALRRAIGSGGMAQVHAADDLETGETVAVKLLRDPVESGTLDRRLLQELLAAAQVCHPNLVGVVDFGIDNASQRPFFVMELLHGEDLAVHLAREGACEAETFIPLFCGALDGLDAVHRVGIIHKDIKPPNLFMDRRDAAEPRLRVMDFGIAHQMQRSRITQEGGLACTPRYTAPEYLTRSEVLHASDVYQMGLVLAEALLGWTMVEDGPFATVAYAHVRGELRLPPGLKGSPVGQVLVKALAREPRERFPSAGAFAHALRQLDLAAAGAAVELNAALYRRPSA